MSLSASSQLKNIMEKEKKNSHHYSGGEKLSLPSSQYVVSSPFPC